MAYRSRGNIPENPEMTGFLFSRSFLRQPSRTRQVCRFLRQVPSTSSTVPLQFRVHRQQKRNRSRFRSHQESFTRMSRRVLSIVSVYYRERINNRQRERSLSFLTRTQPKVSVFFNSLSGEIKLATEREVMVEFPPFPS